MGAGSDWKPALVLLVTLVAIVGFSLAAVPGQGLAMRPGSMGTTPAGPVESTTATGPIAALANSASGLSVSSPTVMGQYTVVSQSSVPSGESPLPSVVTATVALKPNGDLRGFVNELNNPNSPEYRRFLTVDAVGASFGSTSYAAAVNYFESYGLTVQLSPGLLTLSLSGTSAQMGAAFHTTLTAFATEYQSQGVWNPLYGNESAVAGSTTYGAGFYANTGPLSLPSSLTGVVAGVSGLSGEIAQPALSAPLGIGPGVNLSALIVASNVSHATFAAPALSAPSDQQSLDTIQSLSGANYTWLSGPSSFNCYYSFECGNAQTLYPSTMHALAGAENLWSGATTLNGKPDLGQGITIALIEVGCLDTGTIQNFSNEVWTNSSQPGLPLSDRYSQIAVNTGHGQVPNTNLDNCVSNGKFAGWTVETALDVEYASTMAPLAHIDIVGVPNPGYLSDFDEAYGLIAQDLSLVSTGGTCPSGALLSPTYEGGQIGLYLVDGSSEGACSVTITSNSYGEAEAYLAMDGSPMYLTVEDTELELLNAVGVTNFFASGDDAGADTMAANQAGSPAVSPGSTSVGGGQTTAESTGQVYPATSVGVCPANTPYYVGGGWCAWYIEPGISDNASNCRWSGAGLGICFPVAYVASATGLDSFTYWSYGGGMGGTRQGMVGGAFGQSITESQPWWENGLDTYSTGAAIDPVVSFEAAFNMTVYSQMNGGWLENYGGTSFAAPTVAGEWALVEQQANTAFGTPAMGDINPILFAAHNAYEAGVSSFAVDPYVDMSNMGWGFDLDTAPINSWNWLYYNLTIEVPYDPVLPWWFNTLFNPAGPGWNYLQGLGAPQVAVLVQELLGSNGLPGHSLANPAFQVEMVTSAGTLVPLPNTLLAGMTYKLEVVDLNGRTGVYNVAAYSGQSSEGAYGGGTVTTLQTGPNGQFSYAPTTGTPPGGKDATTYGYFLVTSVAGSNWSFAPFAVAQPAATGSLNLCVVNPQDVCETGTAEVTTFTIVPTGFYNVWPQAFVTLNGVPVAAAVVTEVAVNVAPFAQEDPTMPLSSFAPGAVLGNFITGASGDTDFWSDGFTAELDGYLPTQVVALTASYGGLTSNTVTVFIEPQCGSYDTSNLQLIPDGSAVVGTLTFSSMKDVDFINVSIGSAPGQYQNITYPPAFYDSKAGVWMSGVDSGQIAVNLSTAGITGPIQVSNVAYGTNDVSFQQCFFGSCFGLISVQNPIVWSDPITFLPATVSLTSDGKVTGTDTITWTGTACAGATGTLSLVSAAGTSVLATGISGTYALDTTTLLDGYYSVVFTESASGAVTSVHSVLFYANNVEAQLEAQLAMDAATISSLDAKVASVQASLNAANASVASLQEEVASLKGQVSTLNGELNVAQATILSLTAENNANASEVAKLQQNVTADLNEIASLQAQLQTLQNELNAKKDYVAPAWYTSFGSGGVILIVCAAAALVGLGAHFGGRRAGRKSQTPRPLDHTRSDPEPSPPTNTRTMTTEGKPAASHAEVFHKALAVAAVLRNDGKPEAARKFEEAVEILTRLSGVNPEAEDWNPMYQ